MFNQNEHEISLYLVRWQSSNGTGNYEIGVLAYDREGARNFIEYRYSKIISPGSLTVVWVEDMSIPCLYHYN